MQYIFAVTYGPPSIFNRIALLDKSKFIAYIQSCNHAINFDAIEPIIEDLINSGVHGIVVAGTTGEYYAQETKERLQVMKISKDIINTLKNFLRKKCFPKQV